MSEKSFSERISECLMYNITSPDGVVTAGVPRFGEALQIAKEADRQLIASQTLLSIRTKEVVALKLKVKEADEALAAARSPIIFDPTDPRVEIGREYEFSDCWDFLGATRHVLHEVRTEYTEHPFYFLSDHVKTLLSMTFIREIKK